MKRNHHGFVFGLLLATSLACSPSAGGGGSSGTSCASICSHLATAMCSASSAQCETQCISQYASVPSACNDLLSALKSCRATATVMCDPAGAPATPSCDTRQVELEACVRNPPVAPPVQQPPSAATCEGVCARTAATCSRADASCVSQCNAFLAAPACTAAMRAVLACASTATITCSSTGSARIAGCDAQGMALSACLSP